MATEGTVYSNAAIFRRVEKDQSLFRVEDHHMSGIATLMGAEGLALILNDVVRLDASIHLIAEDAAFARAKIVHAVAKALGLQVSFTDFGTQGKSDD